jgi:hypothetical protein
MQEVCDAKKARLGVMMTQRCGKRARIDSIAERILRCHIEAMVLLRAFHGTFNHAKRARELCSAAISRFRGPLGNRALS